MSRGYLQSGGSCAQKTMHVVADQQGKELVEVAKEAGARAGL